MGQFNFKVFTFYIHSQNCLVSGLGVIDDGNNMRWKEKLYF